MTSKLSKLGATTNSLAVWRLLLLRSGLLRLLCVPISACWIFGFPVLAQAGENETVVPRTQLRAALFGFAPWGMSESGAMIGTGNTAADGRFIGVMPSMTKIVSDAIKEPIIIVPVSYARMLALLRTGEVDFAFFFQSDASKKVAKSLVRTHVFRTIVVASPLTVRSARGSVGGLSFASPRAVKYDVAFDSDQSLHRIYTSDYSHAVKLLVEKRVRAVVGPEIFLLHSFRKQGIDPSLFGTLTEVAENDVYLQFSHKSPLLHKMRNVADAVRKNVENGVFQGLVDKYFGADETVFQPVLAPAGK